MQAATQQEMLELLDLSDRPSQPLAAAQQPSAVATAAANQPVFSKSESFLLALLDRGATPEQIGTIMDLADRQDAKLADQAMNEAMAGFKAEAITILKSKQVGYTGRDGAFVGYKHAELFDVVAAVGPALAKHGMSYRWDVKQTPTWISVTCILKHKAGHSESVEMGGPPDDSGKKNSIQQIASTVSYLQRYTLKAICGVAEGGDDNDGRGDESEGEAPRTEARAAATAETYPAADFERNFPAWEKYIQSGKKTADDIVKTVKAKKPFDAEQEKQIRAIKRAQ